MAQSAAGTARLRVSGRTLSLEVVRGTLIAQADVDALVVRVNALLMPIGPAAVDVHSAAGNALAARRESFLFGGEREPIVATEAFALSNKWLLHCQGPVARRHPMYADDLAALYRHLWRSAEELAVETLALEPLGGASRLEGVWSEAGLIVASLKNAMTSPRYLRIVRFVMDDEAEAHRFGTEFAALA